MESQEEVFKLDNGKIGMPIIDSDFIWNQDDGDINSTCSYIVCFILATTFFYLAWFSKHLNLHEPEIPQRHIYRRVENLGIGVCSIVLIPYRKLKKIFANLCCKALRYGNGLYMKLQVGFIVFRDDVANGLLWFAPVFWFGYGQWIIIINLIILVSRDLIMRRLVDILCVRLYRVVNIILEYFLLFPFCCVPWFKKRPVLVQDHDATSELCYNSAFQGNCQCNPDLPKRPILSSMIRVITPLLMDKTTTLVFIF